MKTIRNIHLVTIFAAVLTCCSNIALPSVMDARTGTVSITIPTLGAAFLEAAGVTTASADARAIGADEQQARAFIAVSSVQFKLFAADGTLVDAWNMDESAFQTGLDGGTGSFIQSHNIVPGTGYTIAATIFNDANGIDEASRATVQGSSAPFKIVSGKCSYVLIICKPLAPVILAEGIPSLAASLAPFAGTAGSWNEPASIIPGAEKWYSFTATSTATRVIAQCAEEGQAVMALFVYNDDAATLAGTVAQSIGVEPGEGCVTYATTTIGKSYYVGVIDLGTFKRANIYQYTIPDPDGDHSFTIIFEKAVRDSFESNDTIASAKPLALGETQTHSLYPSSDVDYVSVSAIKDTIYAITTSSVDTAITSTTVKIVDANGIVIADSDDETSWSEGFASIPSWTCPVDGTYYIKTVKGYGQIGEYNIKVVEIPPLQDVNVAVNPGATDPYRTLNFSWDKVPDADMYQIWITSIMDGGTYGPFSLFEAGDELRLADCTIAGTRLSYETPAWFSPGESALVQISWNVDGLWSPLSLGAEGSTSPDTIITVTIH